MKRHIFLNCPRCGAPLKPCIAMNKDISEFWKECTVCNTYVNTYIPQDHQGEFHYDAHRTRANFGGYGSGKTTTSREEFYKHMLITPNGTGLIGATVSNQYEQTIKRDMEADIPEDFIKDISVQKQYWDFKNGYRLLWRPLYDEGIIRSFNLDFFLMLEASEISYELYSQLQTRLRSTAACVQKVDNMGRPMFRKTPKGLMLPIWQADWRTGIIESNPDVGWIRSKILLCSDKINTYGTVKDKFIVDLRNQNANVSSHVTSTDANEYLPANFISEVTRNKPSWWTKRYIYGSFQYADGLVFPRYADCVIPDEPIPKDWKRVIAFDYGLHDDAVYLFGAIDQPNGKLHIYKCVVLQDYNLDQLAKAYFDNTKDIPSGGLYTAPIIDPKSGAKRDYNKTSLADHFLDYGIAFQPGFINVDARIIRTNTYIESGRLCIHNCCTYLIDQLKDYKYPPQTLENVGNIKPMDKNNHSIDPLEWICMALPADPSQLTYGVYNGQGVNVTLQQRDESKPFYNPLSDDDDNDNSWGGEF